MSKKLTYRAMFIFVALLLPAECVDNGVVRADEALPPTVEVIPVEPEPPAELPPVVAAPIYSRAVVAGGILCWNEAISRRADCVTIIHMRMGSARHHHRTFEEELYYLHGDGRTKARAHAALRSDRATNPRSWDSRPWLGDVTADLHMPLAWNRTPEEWPARAAALEEIFQLVEQVLAGEIPYPCNGRARRWGGEMDAEHIARWQARGEVILNCGDTANTFLGVR